MHRGRDQGADYLLSRLAAKMGFDIHTRGASLGPGLTSSWTRKELLASGSDFTQACCSGCHDRSCDDVSCPFGGLMTPAKILIRSFHRRSSQTRILISDASDTEEADTPRMLRVGVLQLTTAPGKPW